jgi:hypothetical protein
VKQATPDADTSIPAEHVQLIRERGWSGWGAAIFFRASSQAGTLITSSAPGGRVGGFDAGQASADLDSGPAEMVEVLDAFGDGAGDEAWVIADRSGENGEYVTPRRSF